MDITSGFSYALLAFVLYSQEWTFKFDFEKIRFKYEKYIVIGISLVKNCSTCFNVYDTCKRY